MNLNHLKYFVKLAQVEHYTKAAKELCITQPSLSNAITILENELGTYLFEKQGRNIALTKYGKVFLKYVEESLNILEEGVKKTKTLTSMDSGIIDLGYIYTLGSEFIPEIVSEFLDNNKEKNFQFTLSSGNTLDIIKGLKESKYDIAFCSKVKKEEDVEFIKIKEEELVVVVPNNHILSNREKIDLKETASFKQIAFNKLSGLRPIIDKLFEEVGEEQIISYEVEKDDSMAGLVAKNFGIAIMPNIPILKYLDVKVLEITTPRYSRDIYLAKMKNKYLSNAVSEFNKFVMKKINELPT